MSAPPWMPFYIRDYLADTPHLTTEQHGAYVLLIFAAWQLGGALPDDDLQLAAITRLSLDAWRASRRTLEKFFKISGQKWHQKRVSVELERTLHLHEVRSKAGSKGGAKRKAKPSRATQPQPHTQSSLRSDSDADASPVSSPLRFEETPPRAAQKNFWKRAKQLVGDSGAVGRQLREVGRDKVDEALNAIERARPDDAIAFFVACCQDRVPGAEPEPAAWTFEGPSEPPPEHYSPPVEEPDPC